MPALCFVIFAIGAFGAALSVRAGDLVAAFVCAYLCLTSLLVYVQLPFEEQMGQSDEG